MNVVEQIFAADYPLSLKIVRLYAVAMLNYRQPLGDLAWQRMRELTGGEYTEALAFLTGYCRGLDEGKQAAWSELVPELKFYSAGRGDANDSPISRN